MPRPDPGCHRSLSKHIRANESPDPRPVAPERHRPVHGRKGRGSLLTYRFGFSPALIAAVTIGCRPARPPDLASLAVRTEEINVRHDRADSEPLLRLTFGGTREFGAFRISRNPAPSVNERFEIRVTERDRPVADLECSEHAGVLQSRPPQWSRDISCNDHLSGWRFTIDLSAGARIEAWTSPHRGFAQRPAHSIRASYDPAIRAIRVYECFVHEDENYTRDLGPLAAAFVLTNDKVTLLIPTREPERSILVSAFLVMLTAESLETLPERPPMNHGAW